MKKIIFICCLVLSVIIVCFCFSNYTVNLSGVIIDNETEHNVNITIKDRHINKLLNKISGKVYIQTENDEDDVIVYNGTGPVFDLEDYFCTTVQRGFLKPIEPPRDDNSAEYIWEHGYMYFDNDFKNMVIITSERQIYAADSDFISIVKRASGNDSRINF